MTSSPVSAREAWSRALARPVVSEEGRGGEAAGMGNELRPRCARGGAWKRGRDALPAEGLAVGVDGGGDHGLVAVAAHLQEAERVALLGGEVEPGIGAYALPGIAHVPVMSRGDGPARAAHGGVGQERRGQRGGLGRITVHVGQPVAGGAGHQADAALGKEERLACGIEPAGALPAAHLHRLL